MLQSGVCKTAQVQALDLVQQQSLQGTAQNGLPEWSSLPASTFMAFFLFCLLQQKFWYHLGMTAGLT